MIGAAHKGALVTLVERKSGMLLVKKAQHKRADLVSQAMIELLNSVKQKVATITSDNGKEFAMHESVSGALQCVRSLLIRIAVGSAGRMKTPMA